MITRNVARKLALATAPMAAQAQSVTPATPKFEVASIRPSTGCGTGVRSGGGSSPGRLTLTCQTVEALIGGAYVRFANGSFSTQPRGIPIEGGPAWIHSERYNINAKAEGDASSEMMNGPMLQALLEDRFKLKVHREPREIPVYELVVSKGGLKLQPFKEGSCTPVDMTKFAPPPDPKNCHARGTRKGANQEVNAQGMRVDEFSKIFLNGPLDRPVIDKTGITGRFDFHLEYAPDQATPLFLPVFRPGGDNPAAPSDPAGGPSIFTAIQEQLGLKLGKAAKGPGEFLIIDSVQRPSEN